VDEIGEASHREIEMGAAVADVATQGHGYSNWVIW
jgi:hypothetical protein